MQSYRCVNFSLKNCSYFKEANICAALKSHGREVIELFLLQLSLKSDPRSKLAIHQCSWIKLMSQLMIVHSRDDCTAAPHCVIAIYLTCRALKRTIILVLNRIQDNCQKPEAQEAGFRRREKVSSRRPWRFPGLFLSRLLIRIRSDGNEAAWISVIRRFVLRQNSQVVMIGMGTIVNYFVPASFLELCEDFDLIVQVGDCLQHSRRAHVIMASRVPIWLGAGLF